VFERWGKKKSGKSHVRLRGNENFPLPGDGRRKVSIETSGPRKVEIDPRKTEEGSIQGDN